MPGPLGVRDDIELTEAQRNTLAYIEDYDLRAEVVAALEGGELGKVEPESAERELKRFLAAAYLEGEEAGAMAPSREVDVLWHNFILNTPSYHRFCQAVYGEYLHHAPTGGKSRPERISSASEGVRKLFDGVDERLWKDDLRICFIVHTEP